MGIGRGKGKGMARRQPSGTSDGESGNDSSLQPPVKRARRLTPSRGKGRGKGRMQPSSSLSPTSLRDGGDVSMLVDVRGEEAAALPAVRSLVLCRQCTSVLIAR